MITCAPAVVDADDLSALTPLAVSVEALPGRWIVLHTKSRMEKALGFDCFRRELAYYLPLAERATRHGRGTRVSTIPVLPGYVFLNAGDNRDDVHGAASVAADLFATGRVCRSIEVKDQARLVADLSNLDRALTLCPRMDPCPAAVTGAKLRIASGPFMGVSGIVVERKAGSMRVVLEVRTFGQCVMEIDAALLESDD